MAGTLGQALIDGAQELSDKVDDDSITPAEWLTYVNHGIKALHSAVTTAFKDTLFVEFPFTIAGSANTLDLTSLTPAFWRVRGLDYNPGTDAVEEVLRFNFGDRNRVGLGPYRNRPVSGGSRRYRVVSRSLLMLKPAANAAGPYMLYYVPAPVLIVDPAADHLAVELDPWNEYVQVFAAIKGLNKEETTDDPLWRRLNEIKSEIEADVETDENGQDSVIDVEDDGPGSIVPWGA